MAQLLSNLLGNALKHGAATGAVRVRASASSGIFKLSVSNRGKPLPRASLKNLFQPYPAGGGRDGPRELKLGLYIASEIARAHGGNLDVTSNWAETRFTFQMPTGT